MEAIFSLPYSEHQTIEAVRSLLPKSQGFGIFIPVSRQQAAVDFVIVHGSNVRRAQVKSSRHFEWDESPCLRFWYRNFSASYRAGRCDLYFLFGLYPRFTQGRKVSDRHIHWQRLVLVFSDTEMAGILKRTDDSFLQFGIDPQAPGKVVGTRGGVKGQRLSSYTLEKRASWLRRQCRGR